jgi:uncharacterized integral membrane protein
MLRKIVTVIALVPLAIVMIAFGVANRQPVTVSFDPFSTGEPAAFVSLPLFGLIILVLILGVVIGGSASWLRQGKWRASARRFERDLRRLREKLAALEGGAQGHATAPEPADRTPQRLRLSPPTR